MKVKRIIEIEEKDFEQICEVVNETESSLGITPFAGSIIAQSTPYNPSGDCISREALKKEAEQNYDKFVCLNDYNAFLKLIDNAPPVETFTLEDMQNNYDAGVDSVIGKYDKAKGEWEVIHTATGETKCKCNRCQHYIKIGDDKNFCPNCGADMRGGAE